MNRWTLDWADMPETMGFDDLLKHPLFANYAEMGRVWQVLLANGVFYTMIATNHEMGRKCHADETIDKISIH